MLTVCLIIQAFTFEMIDEKNINLNERIYQDCKLFHHLVNVNLSNKDFKGKILCIAEINNLKYPRTPCESDCCAQLLENLIKHWQSALKASSTLIPCL